MAGLSDPYISTSDFKARLGTTSSASDTAIGQIVAAASRQIDGWTGRTFGKTATAVVRYFTAKRGDVIRVGDVVSITEIAADYGGTREYGTVWTTDDFDLEPFDAAELSRPYTSIRVAPASSLYWPSGSKAIRITGVFGWPSVPDVIREAAFLQANRIFARTKAPFGIAGAPNELGQQTAITSLDPDVRTMINPYRVLTI